MSSRLTSATSSASTKTSSSLTSVDQLSKQLFEQINSVFDPTVHTRTEDQFMSDLTSIDKYQDYNDLIKNPYSDLSQRAKEHIKKAEANLPPKQPGKKGPARKKVQFKEQSETFQLTNIGLEGNMRERRMDEVPQEQPQEEPQEEMNIDDVMRTINTYTGDHDDLAELRRMIKETKKEMKTYGKDMISLKNSVTELNSYAHCELGYKASDNHMVDMEHQINSFKGKKGFKYIEQNNVNSMSNLRSMKSATIDKKAVVAPPTSTQKSSAVIGGGKSFSKAGSASLSRGNAPRTQIKSKTNSFIIKQTVKDAKEVEYMKGTLK